MATVESESSTIFAGCHYLSSSEGHYDFGPPLGELLFQGKPFAPGKTDTVYRRLEDALIPRLGSSVRIPIEMVKVALQSVAPLTIDGRLFDASIYLTPGKRSTGEMRIVQHTLNDGSPNPNGIYDTNVAIFFTAELMPRDGLSEPMKMESDIFIQSTAHGKWSFNPAPSVVTVDMVAATLAGSEALITTNFFLVGTIPMLDRATLAGGKNSVAIS